MRMEKAANWTKAASAIALLSVVSLAAVLTGCGLPGSGDSHRLQSRGHPHRRRRSDRAGWVLVLRDGDLRLLSGHWERQVTHTGDYGRER